MSGTADFAARAAAAPVWHNEPRTPGPVATAREVWRHRRFVRYLGYRSLRKMYQRTVLGWVWLLILPIFPIAIRALVFGGLLGATSDGIPYFLFLTAGMTTWTLFASALMWGTRGLELHRGILSRVYVPKVILPVATMTPAVLDLAIGIVILLLVSLYYAVSQGTPYLHLGLHSLWALAALALALLLALGIALFTSLWAEKARDARFTMAQVTLVWFLLTPVLYPMSQVPARHRSWMLLNPMAEVVEAFKYGVLQIGTPDPGRFVVAAVITIATLAAGLAFFSWRQSLEADA